MTAPLVFENAGRLFRPDTCEPLKRAARQGQLDLLGWSRGSYPGVPIPEPILPGLLSLGVWDAPAGQDWGLGEHCNEGLEVTFLSRGRLSFAAGGEATLLRAGDATVTAPWLVHEVGLPHVEASRLIWFILDVGVRRPNQSWTWPDWVLLSADERQRLADALQDSDRTGWPGGETAEPFARLHALLRTGDPAAGETEAKILLNSILLDLAQGLGSERAMPVDQRDRGRETVRLFLDRLPEHIDYPWRVEDMARQCGVSRSVFMAHCRELLNCTPHAHLMRLRIDRAMQLVTEDRDRPLTEVAMDCGFSSSAHFSASFRRMLGVSPSRFRERHAGHDREAAQAEIVGAG